MRNQTLKPVIRSRVVSLSLMLGFIFTVIVAQLIAFFGDINGSTIPDQPPAYGANHVPQYIDDIAPPFRVAKWLAPIRIQNGFLYNSLTIGTDSVEYSFGEEFVDWDRAIHGDIPPRVYITRCFVGLPFRCLFYDNFSVANGGRSYTTTYFDLMSDRAGFRTGLPSPGVQPPSAFERRIPLAPVWSGVFANTLIFGLGFYLLYECPKLFRTIKRQRRHECLTCGYAIKDFKICPECGSSREDQAAHVSTEKNLAS